MKTIKQIANKIGVSKQEVQKRIGRDPLYTRLYPYIQTNTVTKYIDKTGESLVITAFGKSLHSAMSIDTSIDTSGSSNEFYNILKVEFRS